MSVKKPKVVLTRYKSPAAAVEAAELERARRIRRPIEVSRWLALIPGLFFAGVGLILIGAGILKIGYMAYYNLFHGEVVRFHPDRELWDQLMLTRANAFELLWVFLNGAAALGVCWSWLYGESRRGLEMTVALIAFFFLSAGLLRLAGGGRGSRPVVNAPPPAAAPQGFGGQAPAFPAAPAGVKPGRAPVVANSNAPVVTIWLDRMTDAERSANEEVLKREFQSLRYYVPETVRIEGDTLVWRAAILVQNMEAHKLEAIAILRRNNIRLSDFSERWLKGRESGRMGPPPVPGR